MFKLNHGYDRDSNRQYADDQVYTGYSHLYGYDNLNRLTSSLGGIIKSDHSAIQSYWQTSTENWSLDTLGNQLSAKNAIYKSTYNSANEITGRSVKGAGVSQELSASDNFSSSATSSNWQLPSGSTDAFSIGSSLFNISTVNADTYGGYTESEARAMVLWGAMIGPAHAKAFMKLPTGAASGEAGAVFGYKNANDYWVRAYNLDQHAYVYHIINGAKTLIYSGATTITAGTSYDLSVAATPNQLSWPWFVSFTNKYPSGQFGLYSTVAGTTFTNVGYIDPVPRIDLCGRWTTGDYQSNGSALHMQPGAQNAPYPGVILIKDLRLQKFQATFQLTGQNSYAYFVMNARDDRNYDYITVQNFPGTSNGYGFVHVSNDSRGSPTTGATHYTPSTGQVVWDRVQSDGTTLKAWVLLRASTDPAPSESDWSGATLIFSNNTGTLNGGQLGFMSPDGNNDPYISNVTIKSYDAATSSFDKTEQCENFTLDGSNYANDTLTNDNNGNLTYDGLQAYTYDAWNRLKTIAHASRDSTSTLQTGQVSETTTYDAMGRRIVKAIANTGIWDCTYHYYLDGQSVAEEQNGSSQTIKQFLWGLQYIDELIQTSTNSSPGTQSTCDTPYFACQDANWNVLGIVNSSGILTERYEYTPYGQRQVFFSVGTNDPQLMSPVLFSRKVVTSGSVTQPYGLCEVGHQGLMHDEESGKIYDRERYFDPSMGRMMGRDGEKGYADGLNLFEYVRSNPVELVDPLGSFATKLDYGQIEATVLAPGSYGPSSSDVGVSFYPDKIRASKKMTPNYGVFSST